MPHRVNSGALSEASKFSFGSFYHKPCNDLYSQAQQQKSVRNYYLPSDSGRVRVCKVMFANTFDLSAKKLRGIHRKATSGAYDEWLKQLLPVQEGLDIGPEEQDSSEFYLKIQSIFFYLSICQALALTQ